MRIIDVVPISRGIAKESLSYFTSEEPQIGSIVTVPLRNKKTLGLVISSRAVSKEKGLIKSKSYSIKKVNKLETQKFFLKEFMEAVNEAASFFVSSKGAILNDLTPKALFENHEIPNLNIFKGEKDSHQKFVIQDSFEERLLNYKSLVREEFAKGRSVVLISPTALGTENLHNYLNKRIEDYTFLLHSSLSKKKTKETLESILEEKHPILIVTTGKFLSIPRNDIGLIIIEDEGSRFYKKITRPFLDYRKFAEIFAEKINAKLIFGGLYLRTETIWRYKEGDFIEKEPLKFRSISSSNGVIVNMKEKENQSKKFKIIGPRLEKLIEKSIKNKEKIFIFGARKGLYPTTHCEDCGEIYKCQRCDHPVVLHKSGKVNFFLCHRCGRKQEAETRCRKCQSWKLQPMGIGIELIEKKIKEKFSKAKIFRLDSQTGSTINKAKKIVENFYGSEGGILLGTEISLNFLDKAVPNSAVVSLDSFFSIPDFRISEKIFNLLLLIRSKTKERFLIQTRNKNQKILKLALDGDLAGFYKNEIAERKSFAFSPFNLFIKITASGDRKSIIKEMRELEKFLKDYEMDIYPSFVSKIRGKFVLNGLIRLKGDEWPEKNLLDKLLSLPPKFAVNVDPDNLL